MTSRWIVAAAFALAAMACGGEKVSFSTGSGAEKSQPCVVDTECTRAGYICWMNACVPRDGGAKRPATAAAEPRPAPAAPEEAPPKAAEAPRGTADGSRSCVSDSECKPGYTCVMNACVAR